MRYLKNVGDCGEEFAAKMLMENGFQILDRNFMTKYGEIDIIAFREGTIHFIEVKTRTELDFGYPADAVTEEKQQRIRRAAEAYLARRKSFWRSISIDVYEVYANLITGCI